MFRSFSFGENNSIFCQYFCVMLNILDTRQRVDIMKNIDLKDYLSQPEKERREINSWCYSIGIRNSELTSHKNIDDVILLYNIRKEGWAFMNSKERGIWSAYWGFVYHEDKPLSKKGLKKIEHVLETVIIRQQVLEQSRLKIKQQREHNKNGDVHMMANPSPAPESLIRF